jgi:hypothetical protein
MLESEVVHGPQLFGRQHDLQPLFPRQAGAAIAVPHDETSTNKTTEAINTNTPTPTINANTPS